VSAPKPKPSTITKALNTLAQVETDLQDVLDDWLRHEVAEERLEQSLKAVQGVIKTLGRTV
jgi:hypothetical protein